MLSPVHRRFLLVDQGVVPTVFNLLLNGTIAWLLFRSVSIVPLWGQSGIATDLLVTAFLLPFLTCVIVSRLVAHRVRDGAIAALPLSQLPALGWSHRSVISRGSFLAGCAIMLAALPVVTALSLASSGSFGLWAFVGFKAGWAALLASVVTPAVGWWALVQASREAAESAAGG